MEEQTPIAMRWDEDGNLDLPPGIENLTGYSPKELKGQICEILTPESAVEMDRIFDEERARGGWTTNAVAHVEFRHKDGHLYQSEIILVFRRNRHGDLVEIFGFMRDVTHMRQIYCECLLDVTDLWPRIFQESGREAIRDLARVFARA